MQIKNDYDILWQKSDGAVGTGVFNGDVGTVTEVDPAGELLTVLFDDRLATYTGEMLAELELAYAVTVHKAQGSEYRAVIIAAARCAPTLMVRNVLYTAITRARELLICVGDERVLAQMAATDRRSRRYSGLKVRLRKGKGSIMKLIHRCLDLLYPPKCVFCDALLGEEETYFCRSCGEKSPWLKGRHLCRKGTYFDRCVAPLYYQGMVRDSFLAINSMKKRGVLPYTRPFWSLMCAGSSRRWMW